MKLKELFEKNSIDSMKILETIVGADFPYVILFKDRESRILYVNKRFYNKHPEFKNNPQSVIGKTDFDLFSGQNSHAQQAFDDEQRVMETGEAINLVETEGQDYLGRKKIAHTRKYPVYDKQNKIVGIFVITEDITSDIEVLKETQEKSYLLSQLNRELTEENTTDSLSGLYNRRFIRAQLDSLYNLYHKTQDIFSVILIDIDDFKRINDVFGHSVGDDVISYIGRKLLAIKRREYTMMLPCRYGGDEFLIILPSQSKDVAIAIAQSIKESFDNQIFDSGLFQEAVQMSMGVATIRQDDNIHKLLDRCDKRLYKSKKDGKHRISY
jgi:diguanylate cyclase (GGDEF)-like protein